MSAKKRFNVALSFSGDHRPFVEQVASRLAKRLGQARVLYDSYYKTEFARPDLDTYMQHLYLNESDLIVLFLSTGYQLKDWCQLEWRAIRNIIKNRRGEAIMILRFDMAEIRGLFSGDGYLWIGDQTPDEIAEAILCRLVQETPVSLSATGTNASVATCEDRLNSTALTKWREKLLFLEAEEPLVVDPDAKFRLRSLIEEARNRIREGGGKL
jgi:hypothetical protein